MQLGGPPCKHVQQIRLPLLHMQILIHPTDMQKMTVDKVNSNAPVYSIPGVQSSLLPCCVLLNYCIMPAALILLHPLPLICQKTLEKVT